MKHRPVNQEDLESRLRADPHLVEIAECLGPVECWVVGGWVRDRALGREPPDLDLVVRGAEAAEKAAGTLGAAWGVTPRLLGRPDKAVWRLARKSHQPLAAAGDTPSLATRPGEIRGAAGPPCKVEIWPMEDNDLEPDAFRRDFTCNALFWRLPDGPLFDPTGGMEDLADQRIRAISRANLTADPVRLLRGVRLMASLEGFLLDPRTRGWIADLAPTLAEAPRERVGAELMVLAHAPRAAVGLRLGAALGLLGPAGPRSSSAATPFTATLGALACLVGENRHPAPAAVAHNRPQSILAWLTSGWPHASTKDLAAFAWPRDLARGAAIAASRRLEAGATVDQEPADRREFIARCGEAFPTVLALAAAWDSTEDARVQPWRRWWRQWTRSGQSILEPNPLLGASEVVATVPVEPGPQLGRILADLKRAVVRRTVRTPAGARRWLRRYSPEASSGISSST